MEDRTTFAGMEIPVLDEYQRLAADGAKQDRLSGRFTDADIAAALKQSEPAKGESSK
jgi:hypothetical protein